MSLANALGSGVRSLVTSIVGLAAALTLFQASAQAANLPGSFSGNAYASYANVTVGPLSTGLGASAYLPCPCQGTDGKLVTNAIAGLSVGTGGSVLKLGAAVSTTQSVKTATTAEVTDTNRIAGINLLGGLIVADALTASADLSATASVITPSFAGSGFVNLRVAGHPIDVNVAPNTVISLPGIGSVTLLKVSSSHTAQTGSIKVEMISIAVSTANSLGLPVGVTVVVGHALSGFSRTQPSVVLGGQAYGASANVVVGSTLDAKIGEPALVSIPCLGTNGKFLTNNVASVAVSGVISLGAVTTSAFGGPASGAEVAQTTAVVANVNLLGGLIGATTITAVSQTAEKAGVRTRSTNGTSFGSLKVLGIALPITVAPNTTIALPLLGKVVLNEQIVPTGSGKTVVNGLHVFITATNLLGLPIGTEIVVAHADSYVFGFPH